MPKITLPSISRLGTDFPDVAFEAAEQFYWSAQQQQVFYRPENIKTLTGFYQLLHELGHALLGHHTYESGIELLRLETAAWSKARELAKKYGLELDDTQVEQCLDSYRDWLHLRSKCPNCHNVSAEIKANQYRCFNCHQNWKVPADQRRRHYRLKMA